MYANILVCSSVLNDFFVLLTGVCVSAWHLSIASQHNQNLPCAMEYISKEKEGLSSDMVIKM